ncbi:hypothetical protein A2W24_05140 [Microgenomates group bacterium RBG_16_45_19]|nr:MAG: hypothetical protein A2W24_05140 [Microgenomates group bacterium RBG_16_45_19]
MTNSQLNQMTTTLKKLNRDLTPKERKIIDNEIRYYRIVIALKDERQKLGLTQEKLAQRSHLPRTTITKIESGSRNTTIQTLMTLAQAMGKNLELRLT